MQSRPDVKTAPTTGSLTAVCLLLSFHLASAQPITVDFENLSGMTFWSGNPVPVESRLSDQLLLSHGLTFRSESASYVAAVALGAGHATSGTNGIGGVDSNGLLSYATPIHVTFFLPGSPTVPSVTDFFSIRNDLLADGGESVTIEAFDFTGALLTSVTTNDNRPFILSVAVPGIHSVRISEDSSGGAAAFDDFAFNTLVEAQPVLRSGFAEPRASKIRLTWPTNYSPYVLEQAESLPAAEWSPATNEVSSTSNLFYVILNAAEPQLFYRLRKTGN